jgi:hypothetical protein
MWRTTIRITSAVALAAGACVAAGASIGTESGQRGTVNDVTAGTASPRPDVEGHSPDPFLKIDNVRLDQAPSAEKTPSAIVKFRVSSQGTKRLTDLYLQISICPTAARSNLQDAAMPTGAFGRRTVRWCPACPKR